MRDLHTFALVACSLSLCGLACDRDPTGMVPSDETTTTATTAPTQSLPSPGSSTMTPATVPAGSSTSGGAVLDSSDGVATISEPSFDVGTIPDMPPPVEPPPEEFDCNDVPNEYVSVEAIVGPRAYHGLAITPDGMMIGSDGSSLIESSYEGMWSVFIPGIGNGQQMDWLADGDLAHATDDGAITRIRLDGTTEIIASSVSAYGVTRGPDDMLYIAPQAGNSILRIDPDTGTSESILPFGAATAHSLGFSPDGRRLYIGTIGNGTLYYVDLDADMNPTSGPMVLSNQVGEGSGWHDAVGVDACGNLYVPDYYSSNLYRVRPDGTTEVYWAASFDDYAHGLAWGTGEHGWKGDALYFPKPYNGNTVGEIVIGAPPRDFDGIVLNAPPML